MRVHATKALGLGILSLLIVALPSVALAGPKPAATWEPASKSNYRRGRSQKITMVVIHSIEGSFQSGINTFQNPSTKVSAHYVVSKTGRIVQMVGDNDTAYHVRSANPHALGIEHEGFLARRETWTDAMYRSSAKLTRWLCDTYKIPIDRKHILGHNEVPGNDHSDPGPYFDWDYYMRLVRGDGDTTGATTTSSSDGSATSGDSTSGSSTSTDASNPNAARRRGIAGMIAAADEDTPDRPDPRHAQLQKNSRGDHVLELQKILNKAGYDVSEDGDFGPETDKAVRAFQRAHGLGVDGIVGNQTWKALDQVGATTNKAAPKTVPKSPPDGPLGQP